MNCRDRNVAGIVLESRLTTGRVPMIKEKSTAESLMHAVRWEEKLLRERARVVILGSSRSQPMQDLAMDRNQRSVVRSDLLHFILCIANSYGTYEGWEGFIYLPPTRLV